MMAGTSRSCGTLLRAGPAAYFLVRLLLERTMGYAWSTHEYAYRHPPSYSTPSRRHRRNALANQKVA